MDRLYTTGEVAEQLRILPYTLRMWIKKGMVKSLRLGKSHLIPASEVERLLKQGVGANTSNEMGDGHA